MINLTLQKIEELLKAKLRVYYFKIDDLSQDHRNHPEAKKSQGGHYKAVIVSDDFQERSLLLRHRMVYEALKEIQKNIHALKITALTVKEFQKQF